MYSQWIPGQLQEGQPQKKQYRAVRACEECRILKTKCDEGLPCSVCARDNTSCVYREPQKSPVTLKTLEKAVAEQQKTIDNAVAAISALNEQRQDLNNIKASSFQIHRVYGGPGWSRSPSHPNFDKEKVHRLVRGYTTHFHSMHPFLSHMEIERLVRELPKRSTWPPIDTALVCLMVALGEVHESPLPDRLIHRSTPSSSDAEIIPGWVYFQSAAGVLNGHSIQHVQGNILAALYLAQLRRLKASSCYLVAASNCIQMHLERGFGQSGPGDALIFAFWTCLQLESEFLLDPPSGLCHYEAFMLLPNLEGSDSEILKHYTSHIVWRRRFQADRDLPENQRIQNMKFSLHSFIGYLGSTPPDSMLHARLWAKCYDTAAEVYRPLLRRILENSGNSSEEDIGDLLTDGVLALIHSITAFDNITQLVVTNVCVTAYMKSVNMSTLLEIYQNPIYRSKLTNSISRDDLRTILQDTLSFIDLAESPEVAPAFKALHEAAQKTDLYNHTLPDTPVSV